MERPTIFAKSAMACAFGRDSNVFKTLWQIFNRLSDKLCEAPVPWELRVFKPQHFVENRCGSQVRHFFQLTGFDAMFNEADFTYWTCHSTLFYGQNHHVMPQLFAM